MSDMVGQPAGPQVAVCVGPGGVGKTTVSAALALSAAQAGQRACVVTIDPARRLADALGTGQLGNEPRLVQAPGWPSWPGELWALMLDAQSTFDHLVDRYATSSAQARAILANPVYRNISAALSGTQEYMAVEKLFELTESGNFDLVVVDTPPARHALDFMEAPGTCCACWTTGSSGC
jgi:anion-transporting  ArsA/GET3 family ATPase